MALSVATACYLGLIVACAFFAKRKVHNETDFLAAGRRLPTVFVSATLFATWFGAGTLLTATDAIYEQGLVTTALEPFGAGACLLFAGLIFAKPLWKMKILTVPDLFGTKFGPTAETMSAVLMVPGYFGWIAVQITALSGIIHMFFGLDLSLAMIIVTTVAALLACLGGMWSITMTDLLQMVFVLVVLCALAYVVICTLGDGQFLVGASELKSLLQKDQAFTEISLGPRKIFFCLNLFCIASLGNLPGQDLAQRVFSARSESIAQRSCLIAGLAYMFFGSISILLGIAARGIFPGHVDHSIIPLLAKHVLSPTLSILLILAIISIILSTMDSALLATSSIIAHNLFKKRLKPSGISLITACRVCVVMVSLASLMLAFVGKNAFMLLEQSYAISLVGLFAPFAIGLFFKGGHEGAAITSMLMGIIVWILGFFFEGFWFSELFALAVSFMTYFVVFYAARLQEKITMERVLKQALND